MIINIILLLVGICFLIQAYVQQRVTAVALLSVLLGAVAFGIVVARVYANG